MSENKRVNRSEKFCSSVKKKDVVCVLSNYDPIQCECAHIVPINGEYGQINFENPDILNSSANGMLLSREFHSLFDNFIWSINPNDYTVIDGIPTKYKYNIDIASSYKNKNISINKYKTIVLRAESHPFIEIAYNIFLDNWNPNKLKLKLKKKCKITEITNNNILKIPKTINHHEYITIDKLDEISLEEITNELKKNISNNNSDNKIKTYFSKQHKMSLSKKYNIHHESLYHYYNKLKRTI